MVTLFLIIFWLAILAIAMYVFMLFTEFAFLAAFIVTFIVTIVFIIKRNFAK